jgi:predicted transporter
MAKGKPAPVAATTAPGPDLAKMLPVVGVGVALWASLPKYSGPALNTSADAEFASHVLPAVVVLLAAIVGILAGRRPQGPGALRLIAGMTVLLAGMWMLATQLPHVAQATRDEAPWPGTIYHTASALAVFGLGLLWSTVTWSEAGDDGQPAAQPEK